MKKLFARVRKRRPESTSRAAPPNDPEPDSIEPSSALEADSTDDSKLAPSEGDRALVNTPDAPNEDPTRVAIADVETSNPTIDPDTAAVESASAAKSTAPNSKSTSSRAGLQNLKLFFQGLEKGLAGIGIPGVEAIAGIPLLIIAYYEEAGAAQKTASELLTNIQRLHKIMKPIIESKGASDPGELAQRINKLNAELTTIGESLEPLMDLKKRQIFWQRATIPSELRDIDARINRAISDFMLESQILTGIGVADLIDAKKYTNIELLKRADGSSWDPAKTCLRGTRVDIIDELVQFASSPALETPVRIQLVTGVLGCGKTDIAHSVSGRCYNAYPRTLGASFIFSREAEARKTPDLLISTIAYSLCGQYPGLADAISLAIDEDRSILSAPISRQFRSFILEPMRTVSPHIAHPITLVIDALDEGCGDGQNGELLEVLANDCAELPPNVRVIITSRSLQEILLPLSNKAHIHIREVELQSSSNREDIALFARHSLAAIAEKRWLGSIENPWPGDDKIQAFVRKAEGLFIWVSTTCSFMLLKATNPTKQLDRLLSSDSSLNLGSEGKMAQLYATVLDACPWSTDQDFAESYELLMGTILALRIPLSPRAIKSLLRLDVSITDMLRPLSPVLTGVAEVEDGDRPLQILHDSFRAYLTGGDSNLLSAKDPRYKITVSKHNQRLAMAVLLFLNRELVRLSPIIDDIITAVSNDECHGVPRPPDGTISEPLWYSCQYVLLHLSAVTEHETELVEALDVFMKTSASFWIVLCSSKGNFQGPLAIFAWCTKLSLEALSTDLPSLAALLHDLSNGLTYMGRLEEALNAMREAVDLRRQLAKDHPVAFTPDLADSINKLSSRLSGLGHREDALIMSREAVDLRRQLANDQPDVFNPALADSLTNHSGHLSDTGKLEEALVVAREAVALREQLVKDQPATFTADLAKSYNNLAFRLSGLGHREEALTVARKAVNSYRQLAKDRPAAFNHELALALNNLSVFLSNLGEKEEALATAREAASLYRQLAQNRPATFTPALASSLGNLSNQLSDLGHHDEALATIRDAVDLYRQLVQDRPAVFTPALAASLHNLSTRLSDLGYQDEALAPIREAVHLNGQLAKDRPAVFTHDLALSLNNMSNRLASLGHREESLAAIREAVDLRRQQAKDRPAVFTPDLAMTLFNLSKRLSALDQLEEGLSAAREAASLFEQLAHSRPRVFNRKHAQSLTQLAGCLDSAHRVDEAAEVCEDLRVLEERIADSQS